MIVLYIYLLYYILAYSTQRGCLTWQKWSTTFFHIIS